MVKNSVPYKEGDWIAVPIPDRGYILGRIARSSRTGAIIACFFSPLRETLPVKDDIDGLTAHDAVAIYKFGNMGLVEENWPIIDNTDDWHREEWPLPSFGHIDAVDPNKAYRREYNEKNLNQIILEVPISPEEAHQLPKDGYLGHRALQSKLSRLFGDADA